MVLAFCHLGQWRYQDNTKSILSYLVILVINRNFVTAENSLCGNHALNPALSFTDREGKFLSWEKMWFYSHDRPAEPWQYANFNSRVLVLWTLLLAARFMPKFITSTLSPDHDCEVSFKCAASWQQSNNLQFLKKCSLQVVNLFQSFSLFNYNESFLCLTFCNYLIPSNFTARVFPLSPFVRC